jgi:hypothetical protein
MNRIMMSAGQTLRASARTAVLVLKVLPMLPSRPIDRLTAEPVIERVQYPTRDGVARGDLYRSGAPGRHPGILVCLGAVPAGQDHPQVHRLGEALARAGFAALLHWSPTMRDLRLAPGDIDDITLAYQWLLDHPSVNAAASGMLGTCVGGAFVLMAAADPSIRDRVGFIAAWAPYASMRTLCQDIVTATRTRGDVREPWQVDPLTRTVFVRSITDCLEPEEAERLRDAHAEPDGRVDLTGLSSDGRAVAALLAARDAESTDRALSGLPAALIQRMEIMSPLAYLQNLHAPLILLIHDRDDPVIPLGETERINTALAGRSGIHYVIFSMFKHLDPGKVRLPPLVLLRELGRFYMAVYLMVRKAVTA